MLQGSVKWIKRDLKKHFLKILEKEVIMSTEYLILRLDQQQTKAEVAFKVPCLC